MNRPEPFTKSFQDYDWPECKKLYIGASGCGKTTLCWEHAFKKEKARVKFIFDHKAMEFSRRYLHTLPVFWPDEMDKLVAQGGTVCFSPSKMFPGRPDEGFDYFCEYVFEASQLFRGRKLLICDELQKLVGTSSKPDQLVNICDIGRTFQIDCFFIASASNAIHNLVLGQMTEAYCFRHGHDRACQWEVDNNFDKEELLALKKGMWLWRNLYKGGDTKRGGKEIPD
jgi:hypothetical protein